MEKFYSEAQLKDAYSMGLRGRVEDFQILLGKKIREEDLDYDDIAQEIIDFKELIMAHDKKLLARLGLKLTSPNGDL